MSKSLAIAYAMKKKGKGGAMHGEGCECPKCCDGGMMAEGGMAGPSSVMAEDHKMLNQHMPMDKGDRYDDLVDRIMEKRSMTYSGLDRLSEGGMVANEDKIIAGHLPNEFDDLALRVELESSYTGANSGDELGNKREDMDRADIVARVMASRRKKDRMPSPA